jgi:hypothetical protein
MKGIVTALALTLLACALAPSALAQRGKQKDDLSVRSVEGVVTDGDGSPVQGAVVYLENTKTLAVRTYNSNEQGRYIFHGLNVNVDYRLQAKLGGAESDNLKLKK